MTTRQRIIYAIRDAGILSLSPDATKDDATPEDLGADSLDMVECLIVVEREFKIDEIVDEELEVCRNFGDFVALVERRIG